MKLPTIQQLLKCVNIIEGYGYFKPGQDGHKALEILEEELVKELKVKAPLGICLCNEIIVDIPTTVSNSAVCISGHIIPKSEVRYK